MNKKYERSSNEIGHQKVLKKLLEKDVVRKSVFNGVKVLKNNCNSLALSEHMSLQRRKLKGKNKAI